MVKEATIMKEIHQYCTFRKVSGNQQDIQIFEFRDANLVISYNRFLDPLTFKAYYMGIDLFSVLKTIKKITLL